MTVPRWKIARLGSGDNVITLRDKVRPIFCRQKCEAAFERLILEGNPVAVAAWKAFVEADINARITNPLA